jgi:hypothetical protein
MQSAKGWTANAAYLYILALDRPAIAWEHLRRNPHYRGDWLRFGTQQRLSSPGRALKWGLRFLRESRLRCPRGAAILAT